MELDITDFFLSCDDPQQYSASVVEYGDRAGAITWANACRDAKMYPLLRTEEEITAAQKYIKSFGAWSEAEITAWPTDKLGALLIQFIASELRDVGLSASATPENWEYYEALIHTGQVAGGIFRDVDGRIYYSIEG